MSFFVGPLAGALVVGGAYYGFSNMIQTRTKQHKHDLHQISVRLIETPTEIVAPPSAAARIAHSPFSSVLKSRWNQEIGSVFTWVSESEKRVENWGRSLVHSSNNTE